MPVKTLVALKKVETFDMKCGPIEELRTMRLQLKDDRKN